MLQRGSGGSGLGQDYSAFERVHGRLEDSMSTIVERYYSGFNNAASIFGGIVENMTSARDAVASVRKDIVDFRDHVQYKRAELPEMWAAVDKYRSTLAASSKMYAWYF
jgi:hypothetical protein